MTDYPEVNFPIADYAGRATPSSSHWPSRGHSAWCSGWAAAHCLGRTFFWSLRGDHSSTHRPHGQAGHSYRLAWIIHWFCWPKEKGCS